MSLEGIDLSSNNGSGHNWPEIKAAGKSFAICKRSEGVGYIDPTLEENWAGARSVAMVPGGYHFAHPGLNSADAEAAYFLSHLPAMETGDLTALDLEVEGGPGVAAWAIRFGKVVLSAEHFPPLLYTFSYYAQQWLNDPGLAFMPLWLADWGTLLPARIGPWAEIAMWQYSGGGSCPGIAGQVDLSRLSRDLAGLKALGKPAPAPPAVHYPYSARVLEPGMLKTKADHNSPGAIDGRHRPVYLEKGAELSVRGPSVPDPNKRDHWLPVQLSAPEQGVHGFLLAHSVSTPG